MLELRILSGLHRGASLPLDDDTVVIGTDESSGVVLLDPGIEAVHASLRKTSDGWALSPVDGDVLGSDTNEPLQSLDLQPGDFGRIGRVWITVVNSKATWSNPPPDPVDIEPDDLQGDNDDEQAPLSSDVAQDSHDSADAAADEAPADAAVAQDGGTGEKQDVHAPQAASQRKQSKSRLVLPIVICAIVVTAWGAYQFVGGDSGRSPFKRGMAGTGSAQQGAAGPAQPSPPTQEELRAAFRKRLAEVDLLKAFDLTLRDNAWTMQAALDDEEAARFERTLAAFVNQHKITFPISAKVGNAEHMLPFKIRQVISGANASVITLDGNRLYVGDEYKGMRLVAIKDSRLTFMGKRKIEVRW